MKVSTSTTFHPKINRQAKRTVQTFEDILRDYVLDF